MLEIGKDKERRIPEAEMTVLSVTDFIGQPVCRDLTPVISTQSISADHPRLRDFLPRHGSEIGEAHPLDKQWGLTSICPSLPQVSWVVAMRVALMQPYFFPYIGYFQLMAACDLFVIFDDAQYIYQGFANRNRILINGAAQWITLPVAAARHKLPFLHREYLLQDRMALRLPIRIAGAYNAAPFFRQTMPLVEEILAFPQPNVAAFNMNLLRKVAARLRINTPIKRTSELVKEDSLTGGERRVIDICSRLGATTYINPIGGQDLYAGGAFAEYGIDLRLLSCEAEPYAQFDAPYVPFLSIIDVLMFNGVPTVRDMLGQYRLLASL